MSKLPTLLLRRPALLVKAPRLMTPPCSPKGTRAGGRWPRLGWSGAAAIVLAMVAVSDAFGCPNCKDAVAGADPDAMNVARGYFYSILIMLAMPFALVGSFGAYVWREMRRQQRAGAGATNPPRP